MWEKRLIFENSINQTRIKQLKLYSVMCYFIVTCMLSANVKVALIFFMVCYHNLYKSPSVVWLSGKQLASNESFKQKGLSESLLDVACVPCGLGIE